MLLSLLKQFVCCHISISQNLIAQDRITRLSVCKSFVEMRERQCTFYSIQNKSLHREVNVKLSNLTRWHSISTKYNESLLTCRRLMLWSGFLAFLWQWVMSDSLYELALEKKKEKKGNIHILHQSTNADASTHGSHDVDVHQSRLRSHWLHYTLFSDQYNVHCHTGTDPGRMEDPLWEFQWHISMRIVYTAGFLFIYFYPKILLKSRCPLQGWPGQEISSTCHKTLKNKIQITYNK